jgi:hypothetical protein
VSTLDALLAHRFAGKRVCIKIDVEGFEYSVLAGAGGTLQREPRPLWLVEVCLTEHHPSGTNPHFADVFQVFWANGYSAYTADRTRRRVTPEDVARWVTARRRDFGTINFMFEATAQ